MNRQQRTPKIKIYWQLLLCMCCHLLVLQAAEPQFTQKPVVEGRVISFALNQPTDVEISVLNKQGDVIRHVAAGQIGGEGPVAAPLQAGLKQRIAWDAKNDYGEAASAGPFTFRVRVAMDVELKNIVGGDPYAYLSDEMNQGNHAVWKITGLEQKSDGTVYVLGNSTFLGPPALRAYTSNGDYVRTVYPLPAGKPVDQMKGWGVYPREDGTYTPQFKTANSPGISTTIMVGDRKSGGMPSLLESDAVDSLYIFKNFYYMQIGVDGTCVSGNAKPLQLKPALNANTKSKEVAVNGPLFKAFSADRKHYYLSGLHAGYYKSGHLRKGEVDHFWRDGQVWKVDSKTGQASVFYSMDKSEVITDINKRAASTIGSKYASFAAFHGIAVDKQNRVFLCDRQHQRIIVLSAEGKILRELPIQYPDAIALSPDGKSLYATVRATGKEHAIKSDRLRDVIYVPGGKIALVKWNDWEEDSKPSVEQEISGTGYTYSDGGKSFLLVTKGDAGVKVWVAFHTIPVVIYNDNGESFSEHKNFLKESKQTCLDVQRIAVDPKNENLYVADGFASFFRISDWSEPKLKRCLSKNKKPVPATSIAIDARRRFIYCNAPGNGPSWSGPIRRYDLDSTDTFMNPVMIGKTNTNEVTGHGVQSAWHITWGHGDRGFAVGPDGGIAALDAISYTKKGLYDNGVLQYLESRDQAPWPVLPLNFEGRLGAIRFDLKGNLYVGKQEAIKQVPDQYKKDKMFKANRNLGLIYKFNPTGTDIYDNPFPTAPKAAAQTYNVHLGAYGETWFRTPRFGIDGWGRIYYPTSILQKINVMDNAGNVIKSFGTWGNRDSMGGLAGDMIPTNDIPLAYPNSVDVSDDYIYVGDMGNCRILRIAKTFAFDERVAID